MSPNKERPLNHPDYRAAWVSELKCIALLVLANGVGFSYGQEKSFQLQWGREFKTHRNSRVVDIVDFDSAGYYLLMNSPKGINSYSSIVRLDQKLNPVRWIDLQLIHNGRRSYLENMMHLDGRLLMFTSLPDRESKSNKLYVQTVSKKSLLPENNKTLITEISFGGILKSTGRTFDFKISNDSSKVMIFYSLPYGSHESKKFGFIVMDNNLNILWKKEIAPPWPNGLFNLQSVNVDNHGNAYLIGVYCRGLVGDIDCTQNYEFKILSYSDQGSVANEYTPTLKNKLLSDMQFAIRNNGDIVCAGFYSIPGTLSPMGTFYLLIDAKTNETKISSAKELDKNFLSKSQTTKNETKEKESTDELIDFSKMVVRSDGGAIIIAEKYHSKLEMQASTAIMKSITYNYFNDIIIVNMNSFGEIDWTVRIPKHQLVEVDNGYHSYAMAVTKDKIHFIYNTSTLNSDGYESDLSSHHPLLMLATVNSHGELKQDSLGAVNNSSIVKAKVSKQISQSQMLLVGQRKRKQLFGKIIFD